jgi:hypothetical protein
LELWNTDTKLGHTLYADMVARLHSFLISANACDYAQSNKPEQRLRMVVVISSAFKGNKP